MASAKAQYRQVLKVIDLLIFNDEMMETLVKEDNDEGLAHGCNNTSTSKESGVQLPTSNGNQLAYTVWHTRLRTFLCSMKNEEGLLLYYVIADVKKKKPAIQKQLKDVKYTGKNYDQDNFRVAQWLESALAEGLAHVYVKKHPGVARHMFKDLHEVYHS